MNNNIILCILPIYTQILLFSPLKCFSISKSTFLIKMASPYTQTY